MQNTLEITPRLTPAEILKAPHVGHGVQLRQKFRFLIIMGVFGPKANFRTVARLMYQTGFVSEIKVNKKTGEKRKVKAIDDVTAYERLENIFRINQNVKSLHVEELKFLRICFERLFGDNSMAFVSDEALLTGSVLQLIKDLNGAVMSLDWTNIDPILALEALADPELPIEVRKDRSTRWTDQGSQITPELPVQTLATYPVQMAFRIFLDTEAFPEKPIVFEFIDAREGQLEDGSPVRAQVFSHVVRSDHDEGPWRVSQPGNKPLVMGETAGSRFGYLAVSGVGRSLDALLPDGANPYALSNADLKIFAKRVLEHVMAGTMPKIALHRYELI